LDVASRDVQREVKGFRNAISLRAAAAFATGSTTLYNKIFRPVVPALTGISNLVIVPHGPLHFIPFQALKNPGGKFMVENFVISYAPSISVLHYCMMKRSPVSKRLLAMALGDESVHGFDALPGTAAEVSLLKKLYDTDGAQSVIGKEFTETRFKENASQFSSIHLATHGVFNSVQPLFSYLLMHPSDADDGYLTIDEIFGLSINSDLVSLSACETALGDLTKGDELVGLSRAFMYAGASTVIVSLWKVEDATTAWLMNRFHQYLLQGKNSALALTMAQRDMIKKGSTPNKASASATKAAVPELESIVVDPNSVKNPANWAPFVLMGNGQN
jgi:CHAT domain-containing protein